MEIDDSRVSPGDSKFVLFTDTFMSGWGKAPARSLIAFAVSSEEEAGNVLRSGGNRTDMENGRIAPDLETLRLLVREGDHLSIRDKAGCQRWYQPDGFAEKKEAL